MKRLTHILPLLLAAALQILPLLRNIVTAPAASSSFAIILRWTLGSSAAIGAFDACSGATNYFTSPTNFTGTVGVLFTNNLTILSSQGDGSALCVITTNGVTTTLANGQTTTFGMPRGLTFKFFDPNSGNQNSLYISISGTPTNIGTNLFHVDLARAGSVTVPGDFTIKIFAASSSSPIITNQPVSLTNVAGGNSTFTVVAGTAPLKYQWFFNTNTPLPNATNTSLSLTNVRASQAGKYSVTITNAGGTTNSFFATLGVTNPLPTTITTPTNNGSLFQFTFIPTVGLTNSVQTNGALDSGVWSVLTNVPPPATASPVTVTDALGSSNRFYRVLVQP